jgi:hypothetical protein
MTKAVAVAGLTDRKHRTIADFASVDTVTSPLAIRGWREYLTGCTECN